MKKGYTFDTHRICDPKTTVIKTLEMLKSSGIWEEEDVSMRQIGKLDVFDEYVYAISSHVGKRNNWGKGFTKHQAMASALMEFCERYSWYSFIRKVNESEEYTHDDIHAPKINVEDLILTETDLENFESKMHHGEVKYHWIESFSLTEKKNKMIPWYEYEFLTTNCLGAGNDMEEALLHAIYETIERHNYNIMMANFDMPKLIDISTIVHPHILDLIEKIKSLGFEVYLMDCSFDDFGVNTIGAMIYNGKYQFVSHYSMNLHMGTHANKDIAIIRALTEIIQNRAANLDNNKFHISMLRDVDYMREDQLSPITSFYLESFRKGSAVVVPYENVKNFDTDDITTELNYVISNLQKSGFEVLSINITNEKLGIACVRVAIPGLQPMIFELFDDLSSKDIRFSRFIKR